MPSIGTWWRTVRHLRLGQVIGRVRFRLARPVVDSRPAPPRREIAGMFVRPAARARSWQDGRFRFLNEARALDDIGWDSPQIAKLWRYNQHYFDDLTSGAHEEHGALLDRWISENPAAQGTGWEPYPTSLRIVNWAKWALHGAFLSPGQCDSLAMQARWLLQRLEWHLLGNHLFVNAKALLFAGVFFAGHEADQWRTTALDILERELPEQILGDGGQFERSPMYHALALEDVLDMINLLACVDVGARERVFQQDLRRRAPRMLFWLRCMSLPDGRLSHFNDSADGVAPATPELERYAAALDVHAETPDGSRTIHLKDSGYARLASGAAIAWLDIAPIGPDYLPGHAHADSLSFELAVNGEQIIVNGGTSCYGLGAERLRERGTAAHSTVQIGDHDSSEVWSGFRVGRRARPFDIEVAERHVCASHDGFSHLPGRPVHRRCWTLGDRSLEVRDTVAGSGFAVARYHLAPGLEATPESGGIWRVTRHGVTIALAEAGAETYLQPSRHAPEFGLLRDTQALVVPLHAGTGVTRWTWP